MAMQWQTALGSADADWRSALSTTLANLTVSEETSLALLFVSQAHASHLREACSEVVQALSPEVLVAVVGAGVAGGGSELEGEPVFSILAGALPEHTALRPFLMTTDSMPNWPSLGDSVPEGSRPSFLLFADPYSPIVQAVNCLDDAFPASVVAGGLSCPTSESAPSLALYTRGALPRVLPSGSVLGLVLGGPRLEVHTACAQGASPVGQTFTVTAGQDNLVEALDGVPALERLQQVAQEAASSDERLLRLLQRALLVGLPVRAGDGVDDFLIRQVMGATPDGGLVLGGERVVAGETQLRFFVRDEIASDADLRLVLDRCAPRPPRLRLPHLPPCPMRPTRRLCVQIAWRGSLAAAFRARRPHPPRRSQPCSSPATGVAPICTRSPTTTRSSFSRAWLTAHSAASSATAKSAPPVRVCQRRAITESPSHSVPTSTPSRPCSLCCTRCQRNRLGLVYAPTELPCTLSITEREGVRDTRQRIAWVVRCVSCAHSTHYSVHSLSQRGVPGNPRRHRSPHCSHNSASHTRVPLDPREWCVWPQWGGPSVCCVRFSFCDSNRNKNYFTKASNKKAVPKVAPDILFTNSVFRSEIPHGLIAAA